MIVVRTPIDNLFNYAECEEMYNSCRELVNDDDFRDIIKRTFFYSFVDWHSGELIGCIYFYFKNERLFLNGFAGRKHHLINLECLKKSLEWFDCDIFAETEHKTAKLCLLKCGFKSIGKNLFVYRRK